MANMKLRICWIEEDVLAGEDIEKSVVSDRYYPEELFFSEQFGDLVSSLEEKYEIILDHGGDQAFYELDLADVSPHEHHSDTARAILHELEQSFWEA